ncbi:MAG: glycosyltransferase [Methylococcaceae bacterium]|jgi:glycosyltransferase involved in cell wall biosynthesis
MRILHIIRSVNPEGGGPIEGIKQLSSYKTPVGDNVEVLSLDDPNSAYVKECLIKTHGLGPSLGSYGYASKFSTWLLDNHRHYDVFIINGLWQYHGFATHKVLTKLKRPYYVFTHGMLDPWFKKNFPLKHFKKLLYWRWGEYPVLRDAKRVLFTCEDEKVLARLSFPNYHYNETVVNFGTAGHIGDVEYQRKLFLDTYPQLKNKRFILYLSRIHPKKGVDLLIKAFANNLENDPSLELVIAGPDQIGWKSDLLKLADNLGIGSKITWPGMLKDDLKWGAYLAAEAFILPSHQENFGIVVAEALSCSLPVLISNKVNIWQEIFQDSAGLVSDDTLTGTIDLLANWQKMDHQTKTKIKTQARHCFVNRFDVTQAAASLNDLFIEDIAQALDHCE